MFAVYLAAQHRYQSNMLLYMASVVNKQKKRLLYSGYEGSIK